IIKKIKCLITVDDLPSLFTRSKNIIKTETFFSNRLLLPCKVYFVPCKELDFPEKWQDFAKSIKFRAPSPENRPTLHRSDDRRMAERLERWTLGGRLSNALESSRVLRAAAQLTARRKRSNSRESSEAHSSSSSLI
ncbi:MAG: hypothetical protein MHMPM18_003496, partial [Marteilia pararefringens]